MRRYVSQGIKMTSEQLIQELERYRSELTGIMGRFVSRRNSYDIQREDDPRYRTFVIEIIDLLNDSIGKNQYSPIINQIFNEGITNYLQTPSYKSIEDIVSVINSVITRLKRNPDFYIKKEEPEKSNPTEKTVNENIEEKQGIDPVHLPSKVTVGWLFQLLKRLSLGSWSLLLFIVGGTFTSGYQLGQLDLRRIITTFQNQQRIQSIPAAQAIMTTAKKVNTTPAPIKKETIKK
jgi:hypothetical protein